MAFIHTLFALLICLSGVVCQIIGSISGVPPSEQHQAANATDTGIPSGVCADKYGNIYFSTVKYRIWMIQLNGRLVLVGGNGRQPYNRDNVPADQAGMSPQQLAIADNGDIYVADSFNNRIRRIDAKTGFIYTVAGGGTLAGRASDGRPATSARLSAPSGIAILPNGNLLFPDASFGLLRMLIHSNQSLITVAGGGNKPFFDGMPGLSATIVRPAFLALQDDNSHVYITTRDNGLLWKLSLQTYSLFLVAGVPMYKANAALTNYTSYRDAKNVTFDDTSGVVFAHGAVFFADVTSAAVYKVENGRLSLAVGPPDDFSHSNVRLYLKASLIIPDFAQPTGLSIHPDGKLLITDALTRRIWSVDVANNTAVALAGPADVKGNGRLAKDVVIDPFSLCVLPNDDLVVVERYDHSVRMINAQSGVVNVLAGTGKPGYMGDGGPASLASLNLPIGVACGADGSIYIADTKNSRIRTVSADVRLIETIAGNGESAFSGDGGPATSASLMSPVAVVLDPRTLDVVFADGQAHVVRKILRSSGTVVPVAGMYKNGGMYCGDYGAATSACLAGPNGLAIDSRGNIYISDSWNSRIRMVWQQNGTIITITGTGAAKFSGDGGLAYLASVNAPVDVRVDALDNVYIGDAGNGRVRVILNSTRVISTVAGGGDSTMGVGDGGPPTNIFLPTLRGLAVAPNGVLYIADLGNQRIRAVVFTASAVGVCPAGYECTKVTPMPCNTTNWYCPGGQLGRNSIIMTSVGYFAERISSDVPLYMSQKVCPAGHYCVEGAVYPCPGGTYGPSQRQSSVQQCVPCPSGRYSGASASTKLADCLPCPPGTFGSGSGLLHCTLCPKNSYSHELGSTSPNCTSCPTGHTSFPGSYTCYPQMGTVASFRDVISVSRMHGNGDAENSTSANVTVGVVATVAVLVVLLVALYIVWLFNVCTSWSARSRGMRTCIRKLDIYSLRHPVAEGGTPLKHSSMMGGTCSLAAFSVFLVLAASIIIQFSLMNTLKQESIIWSNLASLQPLTNMTVATLASALPQDPLLISGLNLHLVGYGSACANVSWQAKELLAGEDTIIYHKEVDTATGTAHHTLQCASCLPGPLTSLAITVQPACKSFRSWASGAGVQDSTTSLFVNFTIPEGHNAVLQIPTQLNLYDNRITGVALRGISLPRLELKYDRSDDISVTQLVFSFAAEEQVILIRESHIMSAVELLSSIMGISGVLGAFGWLFTQSQRLFAVRCNRKHGNAIVTSHPAVQRKAGSHHKGI